MEHETDAAGPIITELRIADEPELWESLGFDVGDGRCRVGAVDLVLGGSGSGRGITGWTWAGVAEGSQPDAGHFGRIDTRFDEAPTGQSWAAPHPNSAVGMFYVVLFGPSHVAAAAAVSELGVEVSAPIVMGASDQPRLRSLAPAGGIQVEVIGPEAPDPDKAGTWRLWGVIIEVDDIDALAERLGDRLRAIKPAAQPGRRIATLDAAAGSSVAIAFMSGVEAE